MMKKIIVLFAVMIFGCSPTEKEEATTPNVNQLADIYITNLFKFYPEWGTFYGIEDADHSGLSNNSPSGLKAEQAAEDSLFTAVNSIEVELLSKDDLITYSLLEEALESSINNRVCKKHLWTINQMDGFHTWYQYIGNTQPIGNEENRAKTIARWKKIANHIRTDMANNKVGLETGYALPKVVIQEVIRQLEQLATTQLESNLFYIPAIRDSSEQFKVDMKLIVENEIMPAVAEYKNFLANEYLDKARIELSIGNIPDGVACYEASLSGYTTLSEKPKVIFEWGEEAIAIRERTIAQIGNEVYGQIEIPEIQKAFKADKSNYLSSKEEILMVADSAITRAKSKIPEYFGLVPMAEVLLEPISELEEKSGSSRYLPASDDGSRPATYIQETYMPETKTKGSIESTAFHETYPGHHLQIAISREMVKSHPITKYVGNSGFSEGWARYTETLADEMGLYTSKKSTLSMLMGLPTGMVVDPGIHFKNWARDEAIAYTLRKQTSMTRADAERYVDRIAVLPGQMTTYGVGEMYFLKLRQEAEIQLGDDFNLKEFHDQCLQNGSVPLDFISNEVEVWIQSKEN